MQIIQDSSVLSQEIIFNLKKISNSSINLTSSFYYELKLPICIIILTYSI